MTLTSNGLTNSGKGAGITTNFHVQYDDSLPNNAANAIANANALLAAVENEFTALTGKDWFNTPSGRFGTNNRVNVRLEYLSNDPDHPDPTKNDDGWGAHEWGYQSNNNTVIALDPQAKNTNAADAAERVKMLFVAEFSEILMDISGKWILNNSSGEGLSQYSSIVRFQTGHYSYYGSWVDQWLNTHPRQDWVTTTEGKDTNPVSFGCALAFLYYLNVQLKFSIADIIAKGASNLAGVYQALTGDSGQPYPFFAGLLEHVYPSSANAAIPGPVYDDPYPMAELSFWTDKNTFGKDEVNDVINTSGVWPYAFWLVVEGFSKDSFNALGVTIPAPTGPFASLTGITISQNPNIDFENAADPKAPQRIRVPYDITFTSASLADFPTSGSQTYELDALLTIAGTKVPGSDASTQFELVAGADPYFTNIDPTQNNVYYLSQDLRLFTATPAQNSTPVPGGPQFTNDSVAGAFSYIQALLTWLNQNYSDPLGTDPFNAVLPGQAGALQGDSSVTPLTVDFSKIPFQIYNNYNFAVARVRLRGSAGPSGAAKNVRVFFRLWSTETADTDYQNSTYPFTPDAAGQPGSPLVGTDHHTLPFFATGNLSNNTDYGGGANTNIRDIEIPQTPPGRDSIWVYYGCFLNLYDPNNTIDNKAVQAWLTGTHHCIVAQIAYDGAPVISGESPETSDKLAQRNLQITLSNNPGPAETHRIPQTFDMRPSAAVIPGGSSAYPDELMIDWGEIPAGSVAFIYWPQVLASDVIALASKLYSSHTLLVVDANTIQCKVTGGVTYIPIPTGAGENFAGLFTVDLPTTVVAGQEFNIVVRRIGTRQIQIQPPPQIERRAGTLPSTVKKTVEVMPALPIISWRYVVGTFQVKIPVSTAEAMLLPEENTLAIMKWRLQATAPSNRWYPVLQRYTEYIAERVRGLGGNPDMIPPSPGGAPVLGIIYGVKFNDKNHSGKRDAGDEGLPGWIIRLVGVDTTTNTPVNREEITDANGDYKFMNVNPGIYQVFELIDASKAGWVPTTPVTVPINMKTRENINVNFGNRKIP